MFSNKCLSTFCKSYKISINNNCKKIFFFSNLETKNSLTKCDDMWMVRGKRMRCFANGACNILSVREKNSIRLDKFLDTCRPRTGLTKES